MTTLGIQEAMELNVGSIFNLSRILSLGDVSCLNRDSISAATSSSFSTPSAQAIRCSVPIELMRTGNSVPVFSKSKAGPYDFEIRSVISVISK